MFDTLYAQIGIVISVAVIALGFLKGDEAERIGVGAYGLALLASLLLQNDSRLTGPQWGLMAVDVTMLVVFVALVWKSRLSWPAWAGGLQALIVMSHLLTIVDVRPPVAAFYAVMNLASYGILLALFLGVLGAWRHRRAAGLE